MKNNNLTNLNAYRKPLKILALMLVMSFSLFSCRDKVEVFSIQRLGVFSYSPDNIVTQYANNVKFYRGKQIVYSYDANTTEQYTRYLLEARGTNTGGRSLIVSIEIDVITNHSFIGIYRPSYELHIGGIHSFNVLDEVSAGVYKSYNLDPEQVSDTYLQVERQNEEEKLVLGKFVAKLRNDQNYNDKLTLYQGLFKDISYANQ